MTRGPRLRGDDDASRAASVPAVVSPLGAAPPSRGVALSLLARGRASGGAAVEVVTLGRTDYVACWRAMQSFTDARTASSPDMLWLTEHEPVYTLGLAGRREHLLRDNAIPVHKVDRGGQVTYHGPGQLVVYVLVDLKRRRLGVRSLVRALEGAVVDWLGERGIMARGRVDAPGVYVTRDGREAKIAALGLKVRNGCTYHGVAVNLDVDLAPFRDIDPCGYPGLTVTRLADLGASPGLDQAGRALADHIVRRVDTASA